MSEEPVELAAEYDGLILDADGVIYRGMQAVPHAGDVLRWADAQSGQSAGAWCLVTNNAAHAPEQVADRCRVLGIDIDADRVITSPQGAVAYLHSQGVAVGANVLAVGGTGIDTALAKGGFTPIRDRSATPVAVVQGIGPQLTWADLAEASYAIAAGAMWVATNADLTLPMAEGLAPGNGSMVGAVANAVGRMPDAVTGKPDPLLMNLAVSRLGSARPLVIGDRIDTDIRGGNRAGMDTLLVMTGVTDRAQLQALHDAPPEDRPTYLAHDLRALQQPAVASRIADNQDADDTDWLAGIRHTLARAWAD